MFMRLVQLKIKIEHRKILQEFYRQIVSPELQKMPGCIFAGIIQSASQPEEVVSMTFWETRQQAEAYTNSEVYQQIIEQITPMLAESAEWKIQLSADMELQYLPVAEEPVLKEFSVTAQSQNPTPLSRENSLLYVRIVSVKLQPGRAAEFRELYAREILPALKKTKGCRYAYLMENLQEKDTGISITIWDSKKDADHYEQSGLFEELTNKIKHTFSNLYQWKMALEKGGRGTISTSADLKIARYTLITGESFQTE